jgi:phage terminase large subunit GpA-like protein
MINHKPRFTKAFRDGLKPDPTLSLDQWAEDRFQIPEIGRFDMTRVPYLKKILYLLSWVHPCQEVFIIKGVQLAFTTALDIINQASIDYFPKHVLNIFGADDMALDWVKLRLETALEINPYLRGKVRDPREKSGTSTKKLKLFKGGAIKSVGGVSGKNFRAYDAAVVNIDDADSLEHDIGGSKKKAGEGNPFKLAKDRTNGQLGRFKFFVQGSPKSESSSLLWSAFQDTDQQYYFVPCPFCNHLQVIDFTNIIYERTDDYKLDSEPYLKCEKCEREIYESWKYDMLNSDLADWKATGKSSHILKHGFHISSAYSLLGYSWTNMTIDWLDACRDASRGRIKQKITFTNTKRAVPWVEQGGERKIQHSAMYKMREPWKNVPEDAVILTMGVDIQKTRIEATIVGNSPNEHRYFIDHLILGGDTIIKHGKEGSVFNELEELVTSKYTNYAGSEQPIMYTCVDCGYRPSIVGDFVRKMQEKGLPVEGIIGSAHGKKKKMFVGPRQKNEYGVEIREINQDEGKEQTYIQLLMMTSNDKNTDKMLHFPRKNCFSEEFFRQFCSEYPVEELVGDELKQIWKKMYTRNEPWDTTNYALAAISIYGINGIDWNSFRNWNKNGCRTASNTSSLTVISEGVR